MKFNHFKVVYKPVVPANTPGAVALYFRNDISNPVFETGLDELIAASSHTSFVETTVWSPASITVNPSDVALKYWDEMSGDFATEVQGMITCITTSELSVGTYGHLYLEYDVDFFSPELDYEVDEIGIVSLDLTWTAYNPGAGNPILWNFQAPISGAATAVWSGNPPPNVEYLAYGVVKEIDTASPSNTPAPSWNTLDDVSAHTFQRGQGFFFRFRGPGNWTDGNTAGFIYADLDSAQNISQDQPCNGQLVYFNNTVTNNARVTFRLRLLAMKSGQ